MADNTAIEWAEATWSPVTGCTRISDGCLRCYIDRTPPFRMTGRRFDTPSIGATTGIRLHPDRLGVPIRWRKPRRIFVCSLADLFHHEVPEQFIAEVFAVISIAGQHTFQVLTKRHARLRALLNSPRFWTAVNAARTARGYAPLATNPTPVLSNAWIGVSAENQQWADIRIPALLATPAAVRWLSMEPLLGPVDLHAHDDGHHHWLPDFGPEYDDGSGEPVCQNHGLSRCWQGCAYIGWVVVGGESGPGARPMHPDWARSLRDQCTDAGVPFFFKQWGEWAPAPSNYGPDVPDRVRQATELVFASPTDVDGQIMLRRGKKLTGRELDGHTWDQFPANSTAMA